MIAKDLNIEELLSFYPQEGKILFKDFRTMLIGTDAMGTLRKDLISALGMDRAKGFFLRYGWHCGTNDATQIQEMFSWEDDSEWLLAGPVTHSIMGHVLVKPIELWGNRETGEFYEEGIWHNSYEAEQHIKHFGYHHEPVCSTLVGYAGGYCSKYLGRKVIFKEVECMGKGDPDCRYIGKPIVEWEAEIESELPYYEEENLSIELDIAKAVGSIASQGNEMILSNLIRPGLLPEESLWLAVPINSPGIHIVCRESVSTDSMSAYDHPIKSRGEEMDSFLIFDNVFVEKWRIFNYGVPELNELYGPVVLGVHWHILSRLAAKAEMYAGAAQLIVDALGTGQIPGVRSIVSNVIEYAQTLRAYVLASEELAQLTEDEVMWPDVNMLTAGRLHGITHYPKIIHNLQELCGQGLVMRFSEKDYEHPFIGGKLEELLFGRDLTSKQKNLLMNFIWDITTDSHAGRIGLFENVNALPAPLLRERLYHEYDRSGFMHQIRKSIGLPLVK